MTQKILVLLVCALFSFPLFAEDEAKPTIPEVGAMAPDFELPSSTGDTVKLSQYRGKNNVVLYFYPRDNTPGCTMEAQKFRDDFTKFQKLGVVILGVSVDDLDSHKGFMKKQELNFPLLADVGGKVARSYGVMGWIMAKRVTFIINKEGKIDKVFDDVNVEDHSKEVFKEVEKLTSAK